MIHEPTSTATHLAGVTLVTGARYVLRKENHRETTANMRIPPFGNQGRVASIPRRDGMPAAVVRRDGYRPGVASMPNRTAGPVKPVRLVIAVPRSCDLTEALRIDRRQAPTAIRGSRAHHSASRFLMLRRGGARLGQGSCRRPSENRLSCHRPGRRRGQPRPSLIPRLHGVAATGAAERVVPVSSSPGNSAAVGESAGLLHDIRGFCGSGAEPPG